MPRVKTGITRRRKHKSILSQTKGYWGSRSKLYRRAHEAFIRAGEHAFAGRRRKKRDMRSLWITRLSAAAKQRGLSYSTLVNMLQVSDIDLNRKVLSDLSIKEPKIFDKILEIAKSK